MNHIQQNLIKLRRKIEQAVREKYEAQIQAEIEAGVKAAKTNKKTICDEIAKATEGKKERDYWGEIRDEVLAEMFDGDKDNLKALMKEALTVAVQSTRGFVDSMKAQEEAREAFFRAENEKQKAAEESPGSEDLDKQAQGAANTGTAKES